MKRHHKMLMGALVLLATLTVFIWYIQGHPDVVRQLRSTSLKTITLVLALYAGMTGVLVVIYDLTLRLCGLRIGQKDNVLLTLYSNVVNFFGPFQSGPGFRMVYLKKRYGVGMAHYLGASVVYYGLFAVISGLFLLSGLLGVWLTLFSGLVVTVLMWVLTPHVHRIPRVGKLFPRQLSRGLIMTIGLATTVQLLLVAVIYFVELRSLHGGISLSQALVYAGAANFSLFVSVTPGALGIRESFLVLSNRLHHIDNTTIITANLIDRGSYVLFLSIVFVLLVAFHGREQLKQFNAAKSEPSSSPK